MLKSMKLRHINKWLIDINNEPPLGVAIDSRGGKYLLFVICNYYLIS